MRATLDELLATLDDLVAFIGSIEPVNKVLERNPDEAVRRYLTARRRLDYSAFVVVLYAAFEGFVESLAGAYAELQAARMAYAELPERLRNKHLQQSGELLARARLGEGRYSDVDHVAIVTNLYDCISGGKSYRLNRHALVQHQGNLKAAVVGEVFAAIGVDRINERARRADPLVQWHRLVIDRADNTVPEAVIGLQLDDLVERRNQVAHSGGDPGESLDAAEMRRRIDFVEAYARALYRVLAGEHLRTHIDQAGTSEQLALHAGPYKDNSVVVVARPTVRICVGQLIVGLREGDLRWGRIQEIQVSGVGVSSVEAEAAGPPVGLRVDFRVTKGTTLLLVHAADAVDWL